MRNIIRFLPSLFALLVCHSFSQARAEDLPVLLPTTHVSVSGNVPLGGLIASTLELNEESQIVLIDLDARRAFRFETNLPSTLSPSLSPDGDSIAFIGRSGGVEDLYWSRWDGSFPVRITNTIRQDGNPTWFGSGNSILFFSEINSQPSRKELFAATFPSGGPVSGVSPIVSQITAFGGRNTTPTSFQQKIAYSTDRFWPGWDICILNNDSGIEVCPLGTPTETYCRPAWSPDGSRIVLSKGSGNEIDLFLYTISNGSIEQLTSLPHKEYDAVWSPDGLAILFAHNVDGSEKYSIKAIRISDRTIFEVANSPGSLRYFSWGVARPYVLPAADLCPGDPLKVAPGICGCGTADSDQDGDSFADCVDACPLNGDIWIGDCMTGPGVLPSPTPFSPAAPRLEFRINRKGAVVLTTVSPNNLPGPYEFIIQMGRRVIYRLSATPRVTIRVNRDVALRAAVRGSQTERSPWSAWRSVKVP